MKRTFFSLLVLLLTFASLSWTSPTAASIEKQVLSNYEGFWESTVGNTNHFLGIFGSEQNAEIQIWYGYQTPSFGDEILGGTVKLQSESFGKLHYGWSFDDNYNWFGEDEYSGQIFTDGTLSFGGNTVALTYTDRLGEKRAVLFDTYYDVEENLVYQPKATQGVSVFINGTLLTFKDQPAIIQNDRTLVPLRGIFEALGATLDWNDATRTINAHKGANHITLKIGDKNATVNGKQVTLDVPAQIRNDRTLVPARFSGESLGAKVYWDPQTRIVIINN